MKKNVLKIITLVVIDQLIKLIIYNTIGKTGEVINIISKFLSINYCENTGGAFGLDITRVVLIGLNVCIIFVVIKLLLSKKYKFDKKTKNGFTLILAGGISNLIDRVFRGFVIDYIDISEIFSWPIFNIADVYIVTGVILIMAMILINTIKSQENLNEKL